MKTQMLIYLIYSFILGVLLSYVIVYLKNKLNFVAKSLLDDLKKNFDHLNTQYQIINQEFSSKKDENIELKSKITHNKTEINHLRNKKNSLATILISKNTDIEILKKNSLQIGELNNKLQELQIENNQNQLENNLSEKQLTELSAQLDTKTKQTEKFLSEIQLLKARNSELNALNISLQEKSTFHKSEVLELQKTAHLQFEKIANQLLEEKSEKFVETNKLNLDALLKPLGENMEHFKKKVEETYDKESKQRFSLEIKVKELIEQTNKVNTETNNLANALKTQVKKQGDWGEMILESILQKSGMEKNREYFLQQTIISDDGKSLRLDVLVKLPDERVIIIDSKVSLTAYERLSHVENADEEQIFLAEHLRSMCTHIENLQSKKYDHLNESLDFTMMFVPIEPAYLIAIQNDSKLWINAYKKRVLLISPTNLIACLKLMADLWKREYQNKNAIEIVKRGELLYEKFVNFVTTLEELGKQLNKTQISYQNAIGQLNTGNGNLIGHAIKLKKLGLKSSEEIPDTMQPSELDLADEQSKIPFINPA